MQSRKPVRVTEMLSSVREPRGGWVAVLGAGFADRIRHVLAGDCIGVVFQPVWDLRSYRDRRSGIVGFEVLARINDGGPAATPDVWFAAAAAAGLEVDLELAVVRCALRQAGVLSADAYLSLNVSPAVASTSAFRRLLDSAPAGRVVLEVSEQATVDDYQELSEVLAGYRRRGVRLAIDDVGAGFASLKHVLLLDPDIIKIDLTIIRRVDIDTTRQSLTASFVSLAGVIGATPVAEGIETEGELDTLLDLGVAQGQGYLLTPPSPADQFTDSAA